METKTVFELVGFLVATSVVFLAMRRSGVFGTFAHLRRRPFAPEFGNGFLLLRELNESRDNLLSFEGLAPDERDTRDGGPRPRVKRAA